MFFKDELEKKYFHDNYKPQKHLRCTDIGKDKCNKCNYKPRVHGFQWTWDNNEANIFIKEEECDNGNFLNKKSCEEAGHEWFILKNRSERF